MINLVIDKKKVQVRKGTTVLEAAKKAGIYIPTLCYHEDLVPYGGCRMCLVEVKGMRTPQSSCTLPARDGMVVKTNTKRLNDLRRFTLELILSEHPTGCLLCEKWEECQLYQECIQKTPVTTGCRFCPKNETCELRKLFDYLKVDSMPFMTHYRGLAKESYDPFFERDYNLCVLCGRCVRACEDRSGSRVLTFYNRGPATLVGTAFNRSHLLADCLFCGACVDACPTGALAERFSRWLKKPERSVRSSCMLCSIGCDINLNVGDKGIVNATPRKDLLCVRGRFTIPQIVNHHKRITEPMIKKDRGLTQVPWDEALDLTARRLDEYRKRSALLFSPDLTTEVIKGLKSLVRRFDMVISSTVEEMKDKGLRSIPKFPRDTLIIVINSDLVSDFFPLYQKIRELDFIVIDPFDSRFGRFAKIRFRPGPGKETKILKEILGKPRSRDRLISKAQDMVADHKDLIVLHDPIMKLPKLPSTVRTFPLFGAANTLGAIKIEDLVDYRQAIKKQCIYAVGIEPPNDAEFIILQDLFRSETEPDIFLPAASFVESSGSFINIFGQKKILKAAIRPTGNSRSDLWIINELKKR